MKENVVSILVGMFSSSSRLFMLNCTFCFKLVIHGIAKTLKLAMKSFALSAM